VSALFKGLAQVGNDSPFAPQYKFTDKSVPQRAKNLTLAKQLLARGGVPNGFSTPLLTETTQEMPHYAQIIKQSAAQIGVDISLTIETPTKYYGEAVFGKSDWLDGKMSLVDYGARSVPNVYLRSSLGSYNAKTGLGNWNAAHFANSTYDKLVADYIAAVDLQSQQRIAGQIERLLLDETPIIFAYFYNYLSATRAGLSGLRASAMGQTWTDQVSVA
jgi:peptide/nickel transport system substrate-binding protein